MELARLFIGLPLPEFYQEGLDALVRALKPVVPTVCSWTRPGTWHLTLKFLGDTPVETVPALQAALKEIPWEPFAFRAGGGGFFPSAERPRVMWVGAAEGGLGCRELSQWIEAALGPIGVAPETRPFSAHLTVARIKSCRYGADWRKALGIMLKTGWPEITVDRFVLWRSYLGGGSAGDPPGPHHVPLGEYEAAG